MAALLKVFPEAPNAILLAAHIAAGATAYLATLAVLYAPSLFRMLRARPQRSKPGGAAAPGV
jgi:hypothetical protein